MVYYKKQKMLYSEAVAVNIFQAIRTNIAMTQEELAQKLEISFATVNRWENAKTYPTQKSQEKLFELCEKRGVNASNVFLDAIVKEVEAIQSKDKDRQILFHGSKSGISGGIKPISRDRCDFGSGFYMGTDPRQPLTLVCDYEESIFYILSVNPNKLKTLTIPADIEWAMFVAYNRGRMDEVRDTEFYKKYQQMGKNKDIIIGSIANDRMFFVLDNFFRGNITDMALTQSLSALNLGQQYVAVTQKACDAIAIEKKIVLPWIVRQSFKKMSEENRRSGVEFANRICKEYRREGQFFDEILANAKR